MKPLALTRRRRRLGFSGQRLVRKRRSRLLFVIQKDADRRPAARSAKEVPANPRAMPEPVLHDTGAFACFCRADPTKKTYSEVTRRTLRRASLFRFANAARVRRGLHRRGISDPRASRCRHRLGVRCRGRTASNRRGGQREIQGGKLAASPDSKIGWRRHATVLTERQQLPAHGGDIGLKFV